MNIKLITSVKKDYKSVFEGFDEKLFLELAPVFPKVNLLHFGGCKKGDEVHLELDALLFKQRWDALIIEQGELENEIYFIDKGTRLPFFLITWQHRHRIVGKPNGTSEIIDDFDFTTPFFLFDYLIYPFLYLQFAARKPIYQRIFS
jgi:ligand-binding SRPBCC domain-containing protein